MKIAIDTNILAYAEGVNGEVKRDIALKLLLRLDPGGIRLPAQTLGELFNVLVRKAKRPPADTRTAVASWSDAFEVFDTSSNTVITAMDLAADHGLSIWDAVIVAGSVQAGCRLLLSEDLQNGFTWQGLTVVNPFSAEVHPLLQEALQQSTSGAPPN